MQLPRVLLPVLFIDAGPDRSAWVIVEVMSNGSIIPTQGGWRSMRDIAWLGGLMESVWERVGVVALEYIDGALYDRKRWRELGETQRVEGDIRTTARGRGADHALIPFHEMRARRADQPRTLFCVPASSWRKDLLGRGNARNCEIAIVVTHLCGRDVEVKPGKTVRMFDLPGVDSASREHIMDATGGAIVVASAILGAPIRVPAAVRAEQDQARADAGRKNAIRRKLEGLGVSVDRASMADGTPVAEAFKKRGMSRGVRAGRRAVTANSKATSKRNRGAR